MTKRSFLIATCATSLFLAPASWSQDDPIAAAEDTQDQSLVEQAVAETLVLDDRFPLTPEDERALDALNASLNALDTLQASFLQIRQDTTTGDIASASGLMQMQRPGLMRFAYNPPQEDPSVVISDGSVVYMHNSGLGCVDEFSLRATPLQVFLKDNVNLLEDTKLVGLDRTDTQTVVSVSDATGELDYILQLRFSPMPQPKLQGWTVIDEFGQTVETHLTDVVEGQSFDRGLFRPNNDWPRDRDGLRDCAV